MDWKNWSYALRGLIIGTFVGFVFTLFLISFVIKWISARQYDNFWVLGGFIFGSMLVGFLAGYLLDLKKTHKKDVSSKSRGYYIKQGVLSGALISFLLIFLLVMTFGTGGPQMIYGIIGYTLGGMILGMIIGWIVGKIKQKEQKK